MQAGPGWRVCGIIEVFYTDHGSDFTSWHLQYLAADLKIRLINSGLGQPCGWGKIGQFFETISQVLLLRLFGYMRPLGMPNALLETLGSPPVRVTRD